MGKRLQLQNHQIESTELLQMRDYYTKIHIILGIKSHPRRSQGVLQRIEDTLSWDIEKPCCDPNNVPLVSRLIMESPGQKFREMELIPEKGFGPIVSIKASISRSFTSGIWSENHYVLGLVDGLMEDDDGLKTSFIKYIALRMPENVLQLIDSMAGPFLPLNISLLLPDERIRSQCLSVVEYKLRQQGLPELSS
ncbi:hypothetical protein F2Q70_00018768 [Brassica cretica]|uniref:Uncharacterized protein n=1 Tax=Brassica cretica TaxID=69181 RepID=A0A8S9I4K3_BRACR|nr:hypothetical protein F2Q70_00018768 [Brassica cretica]